MHGMSYCIIKRCVGAARVTARMIYIRLESRSTNETSAFFRGDFEQNPAAVPRNNNVGKTTLSQTWTSPHGAQTDRAPTEIPPKLNSIRIACISLGDYPCS